MCFKKNRTGHMIGEGRLRALSKSQKWPAGPVILKIKKAFCKG